MNELGVCLNMKNAFVTIGLLLFAVAKISYAGEQPGIIQIDLDGDGKQEKITWNKFASTEDEGDFYQLRVFDDDGQSLLWEGPKSTSLDNPLVFGDWHFGYSLPEIAADIDQDGKVELVTPLPMSDVSPTWFQIVRWSGGRFVVAHRGALLESQKGSENFPWNDTETWNGTWISEFHGVEKEGGLKVEIFEYDGENPPRSGTAVVKPTRNGFQVAQWIRNLTEFADNAEDTILSGLSMPNQKNAGGGGSLYRARLSAGDHQNSAGTPLTSAIEILRQDRANFHKGNGDNEDKTDAVFSSLQNRNAMESLRLLPVGASRSAWEKAIVNGTPLVEVRVSEDALTVEILD